MCLPYKWKFCVKLIGIRLDIRTKTVYDQEFIKVTSTDRWKEVKKLWESYNPSY